MPAGAGVLRGVVPRAKAWEGGGKVGDARGACRGFHRLRYGRGNGNPTPHNNFPGNQFRAPQRLSVGLWDRSISNLYGSRRCLRGDGPSERCW